MKVVCLTGPSDSGKTSLVEELVPALADHGRVATVKAIHHDIDIDEPGTDTFRHREAGAETVVGITPGLTFSLSPGGKRNPPPDPDRAGLLGESAELQALEVTLHRLERQGVDIVLVEGYSEAPLPTIVVGEDRPERAGPVIATDDAPLEELVRTILDGASWQDVV